MRSSEQVSIPLKSVNNDATDVKLKAVTIKMLLIEQRYLLSTILQQLMVATSSSLAQ